MHDIQASAARLSRRDLLKGAVATGALLMTGAAAADEPQRSAREAIAAVIGDRTPEAGQLKLITPAIAENGNTVPISVEAGARFTPDHYVEAIHVFALENPEPEVISFHFTPRSGLADVSTRIRLAKTQQVVAIAELSDGRVWRTANEVKVTIGGCGG